MGKKKRFSLFFQSKKLYFCRRKWRGAERLRLNPLNLIRIMPAEEK